MFVCFRHWLLNVVRTWCFDFVLIACFFMFFCLVFSLDTLGNASANSCSKAHQWQLALQIASQARNGVICMYGIYLSWILTLRCFLGRLLVVQYVSIIPTQIDCSKGFELLTLKGSLHQCGIPQSFRKEVVKTNITYWETWYHQVLVTKNWIAIAVMMLIWSS